MLNIAEKLGYAVTEKLSCRLITTNQVRNIFERRTFPTDRKWLFNSKANLIS